MRRWWRRDDAADGADTTDGGPPPAPTINPIFHDQPDGARVNARRKAMREAHGGAFPSALACDRFFGYMVTPPGGRWAFRPNGKTATTRTLEVLFQLEFGHPNTAEGDVAFDLNPDGAAHRMTQAQVFRHLIERDEAEMPDDYLRRALYVVTVRDPAARALSAFRYLCRAHAERHAQFLPERLRMCAAVGFDWQRHPGTTEGFALFLRYLQLSIEAGGTRPIDNHWVPQVRTIRPDLFAPDLIGRSEDMVPFFTALVDHLARPGHAPDPRALAARRSNVQGAAADTISLNAPEIRALLTACYAEDYETFGYAI